MRSRPLLYLSLVAVALATAGAMGCSRNVDLEPAPGAERASGYEGAAVDRVKGVRVIVRPNSWTGDPSILARVTPVRIVLENDSDRLLRIRYDDFSLVSPQGARFSAIPPFEIKGTVSEPALARAYDPLMTPEFTYNGFWIAPYAAPIYPTLSPYADPFHYDSMYNDRYFTYWNETPLPTPEMLRRALPEGVVEPGGDLNGFLFFENVTDVDRVRYQQELVGANTGERFGTITIPFAVEPR